MTKARPHCVLWPAQFGRKLVLGTRRKWPRPRRDRDVDNFSRDETDAKRWYVSRPRRRDRDHNPVRYSIRPKKTRDRTHLVLRSLCPGRRRPEGALLHRGLATADRTGRPAPSPIIDHVITSLTTIIWNETYASDWLVFLHPCSIATISWKTVIKGGNCEALQLEAAGPRVSRSGLQLPSPQCTGLQIQ